MSLGRKSLISRLTWNSPIKPLNKGGLNMVIAMKRGMKYQSELKSWLNIGVKSMSEYPYANMSGVMLLWQPQSHSKAYLNNLFFTKAAIPITTRIIPSPEVSSGLVSLGRKSA